MNWTKEQLQEKLNGNKSIRKAVVQNRVRLSVANVEQVVCVPSVAEKKYPRLDSQRNLVLRVHSRRYRLTDADGASAKAVIDGLTQSGLLEADSPEVIQEVRFSQEKISKEEVEQTIVEIFQDTKKAQPE